MADDFAIPSLGDELNYNGRTYTVSRINLTNTAFEDFTGKCKRRMTLTITAADTDDGYVPSEREHLEPDY